MTVQLLALLAAIGIGLALGVGAFTFVYAKGSSYLGTDPAACANCHIMREHFDAWNHSSHRLAAACNDCHTPHGPVSKYLTKARNGFWHSFYFTTGRFPDPLRITPRNREITESACRSCHQAIVEAIDPPARPAAARLATAPQAKAAPNPQSHSRTSCIRCHEHVGHWIR